MIIVQPEETQLVIIIMGLKAILISLLQLPKSVVRSATPVTVMYFISIR